MLDRLPAKLNGLSDELSVFFEVSTPMIGAIAGDIIGSVYEHAPVKTKAFPLFHPRSRFTDDTVLTVAVANAIIEGIGYASSIRMMRIVRLPPMTDHNVRGRPARPPLP